MKRTIRYRLKINSRISEVNLTYRPVTSLAYAYQLAVIRLAPVNQILRYNMSQRGVASGQYVVNIFPRLGITQFSARHMSQL